MRLLNFILLIAVSKSFASESIPAAIQIDDDLKSDKKLMAIALSMKLAYGVAIEKVSRNNMNNVSFKICGNDFIYDDGRSKTADEYLSSPDIEDMFNQAYPIGDLKKRVTKDFDPGRSHVESLFKLLYGSNIEQVQSSLEEIDFFGTKVQFNSRFGAAKELRAIIAELNVLFKKSPELKEYTQGLGGAFNWRPISGTSRLSSHSFGISIDLNVKKSSYWLWSKSFEFEALPGGGWPIGIIKIFENHGFIWGGKWWHYDTMHFEYRPELLAYSRNYQPENINGK